MLRWAMIIDAGPLSVSKYLFADEHLLTSMRQHPAILIGPSVLALAGIIAASILSTTIVHGDLALVIWAVCLVLLARAILRALNWTASFFVLSSDRILMITGYAVRKVANIPLSTVNDLSFRRSLGGVLLRYGSFDVTSGAPDQVLHRLEYIPYPEEMYLKVMNVIFAVRSGLSSD